MVSCWTTTGVTDDDGGEETGILPEMLAGICTTVTGAPVEFVVATLLSTDCILRVRVVNSTATAAHKVIVLETLVSTHCTVRRPKPCATFTMPYMIVLH